MHPLLKLASYNVISVATLLGTHWQAAQAQLVSVRQDGGSPTHAATPLPPSAPPGEPDTVFAVDLAPRAGRDFKARYRAAIRQARALGLTPFVEYGAPWCAPCQRLRTQLQARPLAPSLRAKFAGAALIRITTDAHGFTKEWPDSTVVRDVMGVHEVIGLPVFFAIDTTGQQVAHVYGIEWIMGEEDITQPDGPPADRDFLQHHLWPSHPATQAHTRR